MTDPLSDEIDEDLWNEASSRADAIRRFLKDNPGRTSAADIARLADELDLSRASVFRLIKLFRVGGTVASLLERKRGRPVGHRTLDP
ncbi:helix-turn-helix domain-containing protein, partial [uncultured Roseobacter sp.]|uniref:helix-turn-helix domain-containing protein n=1 Tax=uncultured Roseobacter sp. TaxID=114847 RepID=UPI00261054D8